MGECCFPEITIGKHMGSTCAAVRAVPARYRGLASVRGGRQWQAWSRSQELTARTDLAHDASSSSERRSAGCSTP